MIVFYINLEYDEGEVWELLIHE